MFQAAAHPAPSAKGSHIQRAIALLGTALGIGIAILTTPTIFGWTKKPLFAHLLKSWGEDWATFLTYIMGGVEAFLIYGGTKLLFTLVTVWTAAALAARRFPGV